MINKLLPSNFRIQVIVPEDVSSSAAATGAVFFNIAKRMSSLPLYFAHERQRRPKRRRAINNMNIAAIIETLQKKLRFYGVKHTIVQRYFTYHIV